MSSLCLDTSAYSFFRRGHSEATRLIRGAREVLMPAVTLGELRIGFKLGDREGENEAKLQAFLGEPGVRLVAIDDEVSQIYADFASSLRRAGTPMPTNDIWIAAAAVRQGAALLTFDDHFLRLPGARATILKP